ncbi:MAG: cell division protein FtsA [Acidobacteria bacterium]|nr:cell division protein FtsA [Acidobacteriota bacterium]MBI3657805.1 cell division protein FtsA [Acidobacteriota bacterium]
MAKKKERIISGIDIGSTKVSAFIGKINGSNSLEFVGAASTECHGLRKGVVINLEAVVCAVKKVMAEAETQAGVAMESAFVGLSGGHVRGFNNRGLIPTKGRNHEISVDDVKRVVEAARAISLPADKEIIHILPQCFSVDGDEGITDPLGMTGSRLEVNVHIITASITAAQNIVTAINRCGLMVTNLVLQQLAAAEAVLTQDEKELGCLIVDIGGGTTDLAVFYRGTVWHSAILPVGGDNFTRDLAVGLCTPIQEAERIKREFGSAIATSIGKGEMIEVSGVGGRPSRPVARELIYEIVQPRAEEILEFVREEVERTGLSKQLTAGVVLTGGGSLLSGMVELSEQVLGMTARRGCILDQNNVSTLSSDWLQPMYATAVGLVRHGFNSTVQPPRSEGNGHKVVRFVPHAVAEAREWLRSMLF